MNRNPDTNIEKPNADIVREALEWASQAVRGHTLNNPPHFIRDALAALDALVKDRDEAQKWVQVLRGDHGRYHAERDALRAEVETLKSNPLTAKWARVKELTEENERLKREDRTLRRLLWLRHDPAHYPILYGDDGEMQCGACMLDFKRLSAEEIDQRFQDIALRALPTREEGE